MTMHKGWRHSVGKKGLNRVTVYTRPDSESLCVEWWHGGKRRRRSLASVVGHAVTDKADAVRIAVSMAERLERGRIISLADRRSIEVVQEAATGLPDRIANLSHAELLAAELPTEPLVGVYFLSSGGDIVYIGQSKHIMMRLWQHRRRPVVAYDSASWVPVPKEHLDEVESRLIHRFRPIGNSVTPRQTTRPPHAPREAR